MSNQKTPTSLDGYDNDLFSITPQHTDHNSHWGDKMTHKYNRTLRVYFQNTNGLPSNDHWAEWNHIISYLTKSQIDIGGFAEPNIKWTKQLTASAKRHLLAHSNPATLQTTSCDEPSKFRYQRGGVAMTTIGRMTGRIGDSGHDIQGLGRWTYTKYFGKEGRTLIVVTAYRVAQTHLTKWDNTAFNQQYRALRRQGIDNPKPKIYSVNTYYLKSTVGLEVVGVHRIDFLV